MKKGEPVIPVSFKISSARPPLDFFAEVCRVMGIDPGKPVRIGYRVIPSNKSEPFVRFETEEDIRNAVTTTLIRMKRVVSRPVQLELCNLVCTLAFAYLYIIYLYFGVIGLSAGCDSWHRAGVSQFWFEEE